MTYEPWSAIPLPADPPDPETYEGRKRLMEERDYNFDVLWKEVERSPAYRSDLDRQLSARNNQIVTILYRAGVLNQAYIEHRKRKGESDGL